MYRRNFQLALQQGGQIYNNISVAGMASMGIAFRDPLELEGILMRLRLSISQPP